MATKRALRLDGYDGHKVFATKITSLLRAGREYLHGFGQETSGTARYDKEEEEEYRGRVTARTHHRKKKGSCNNNEALCGCLPLKRCTCIFAVRSA